MTDPRISNPHNQPALIPKPLSNVRRSPKVPHKVKQFSDAPDLDLFRLAQELVPGSKNLHPTVAGQTKPLSAGHSETFWLVDMSSTVTYQSDFTLALVTRRAYWYVENGLKIDVAELGRSAAQFEEIIYPVITRVFGSEWNPGVDNDPRLTIVNARLTHVAGYFSSADEYPASILPRSNQRELIYINADSIPPGSSRYAQVLSHELQHAIHWNADASEDTWVNEGLSELASGIALNSESSIHQFLKSEPISLINWPTTSSGSGAHYGAASLFMHFFTEHYGGQNNLKDLLAIPEDSIAGIDAYLELRGYDDRFTDVFKEWAVANVLDNHIDGSHDILGYKELEISAAISENIIGLKPKRFEIPQYAVAYTELKSVSEPFHLSFQGATNTPLLPVDVGASGCWWSNSGDSIDSTLARQVNVVAGSSTVLEYDVWFEVEEGWDYVYVEVSIDGGENWQVIDTPRTSPQNPVGISFGPGYTGNSGTWLSDSVELAPFANEDLWVRFQYVTDESINAAGACLRNLSITTSGVASNDNIWDAQGFLFTNNVVQQDFQVQLITTGDIPQVRELVLDANNTGRLTIQPPRKGEKLIVAVGSLAEKTREPAHYTLSLTSAR